MYGRFTYFHPKNDTVLQIDIPEMQHMVIWLQWFQDICKVVPSSYKLVYNPINYGYIDISTINPSEIGFRDQLSAIKRGHHIVVI